MPIVVALAGCSKEPVRTNAAPAAERETVTGVVRVVKGDKTFLEQDSGAKWVLSEVEDPLLYMFDGRRVVITGERSIPSNQMYIHLRPISWHVEKPAADDELVSVGGERVLRGAFKVDVWPEGTKLAGERSLTFVTASESYRIDRQGAGAKPNVPVTVHARDIVESPFSAHASGPSIFIVSIESER